MIRQRLPPSCSVRERVLLIERPLPTPMLLPVVRLWLDTLLSHQLTPSLSLQLSLSVPVSVGPLLWDRRGKQNRMPASSSTSVLARQWNQHRKLTFCGSSRSWNSTPLHSLPHSSQTHFLKRMIVMLMVYLFRRCRPCCRPRLLLLL